MSRDFDKECQHDTLVIQTLTTETQIAHLGEDPTGAAVYTLLERDEAPEPEDRSAVDIACDDCGVRFRVGELPGLDLGEFKKSPVDALSDLLLYSFRDDFLKAFEKHLTENCGDLVFQQVVDVIEKVKLQKAVR